MSVKFTDRHRLLRAHDSLEFFRRCDGGAVDLDDDVSPDDNPWRASAKAGAVLRPFADERPIITPRSISSLRATAGHNRTNHRSNTVRTVEIVKNPDNRDEEDWGAGSRCAEKRVGNVYISYEVLRTSERSFS